MSLAHTNLVAHFGTALAGCVLGAVYISAWALTAHRSRRRVTYFLAGLALAIIADSPPAEIAASATFTAHMVQHLVLYVFVPLLIALARPTELIPPRYKGHRVLYRLRPWTPVAAVSVTTGVLYALHLTSLYDLALDSAPIHLATHAGLIGAGVMLWSLALRPGFHDGPARFGIAIFTSVPITALGVVLTTSDTAFSSHYVDQLGPAEALIDQHRGGSLMWIGAMLAGAAITLTTAWRWASHEQQTQNRIEQTRSAMDLQDSARF